MQKMVLLWIPLVLWDAVCPSMPQNERAPWLDSWWWKLTQPFQLKICCTNQTIAIITCSVSEHSQWQSETSKLCTTFILPTSRNFSEMPKHTTLSRQWKEPNLHILNALWRCLPLSSHYRENPREPLSESGRFSQMPLLIWDTAFDFLLC